MKALLPAFLLFGASVIHAASVTYQFTGNIQNTMTVNNGTNAGTIAAGTPFSGSFTFDDAQTGSQVAYAGGIHATYTFTSLSMTIAGSTAVSGPGNIDLFYHVTSSTSGYPNGDSFYVNFTNMVAPGGLLDGVTFNWLQFAMVDPTGTAFTSPALPANLNFSSFLQSFAEFNYGTTGQALGAGNTSTIQFISTLANTSAAAPPTITTSALPPGVYGVPYSAPVTATGPNGDPVTLQVTGLPTPLSFNGSSIAGTPASVGTSTVSITATDTVTSLSTSVNLPLVINDAAISFAPSLPSGLTGSAYSATFAPATGGTGTFTYSATGLPTGFNLSGTTVSGTTSSAGTANVVITATDTANSSISAQVSLLINNPAPVPCSGSNGVESGNAAGLLTVNGGGSILNTLLTSSLPSGGVTLLGGLTGYVQNGLILNWTGTVASTGCSLASLTVSPAVTISTTPLPGGTAGIAYSAPVTVSYGVAPYKVTVSGLPAGLTYSSGNIAGIPTVVGVFPVTVTAVDSVGANANANLSLTVLDQSISFTPALPAGTVGTAYSATLSASGFGPFTYTATGLPAGLTLTGSSISGKPTTSGTSKVSLTAKDAAGVTSTVQVSVTINAAASGGGNGGYTIEDESQGKITAIAPDLSYIMVGAKKLIWNSATHIQVNTDNVDLHTVTSFVKTGMPVQWKGLRNAATDTVLTSQLEIN